MELSVEGYKSISSKTTLSFNGLTILSGANSSGKSSFMQPFLILKQTIENHYDSGILELFGENVKLTDSTQIISKVPGYKSKTFGLYMKVKKGHCYVSYKYKRGYGLQAETSSIYSTEIPDGLNLYEGMTSEEIDSKIPSSKFDFLKKVYKDRGVDYKWTAVKNKCFIRAQLSTKGKDLSFLMAGVDPADKLEDFVTSLIHVPGVRGNPERNYKIAASEDIYPGSFEKYVASIVSVWMKLKRHQSKYKLLKDQLLDLGLASNIRVHKIDDTSVEIQISRTNNCEDRDCVNIADVGFGVSQTLPVLVALIAARKGQYVYIEQPELHLHPKAQYKLASIISSSIKRGVNVIIETHSSILIRGVQIAVVKKELEKEKVSLNWFTQDKETGETKVSKAQLDDYGAFGDWPEDFDDTTLYVEQKYLDAVQELLYE